MLGFKVNDFLWINYIKIVYLEVLCNKLKNVTYNLHLHNYVLPCDTSFCTGWMITWTSVLFLAAEKHGGEGRILTGKWWTSNDDERSRLPKKWIIILGLEFLIKLKNMAGLTMRQTRQSVGKSNAAWYNLKTLAPYYYTHTIIIQLKVFTSLVTVIVS